MTAADYYAGKRTPLPWISGFCNPRNDDASHDRCRGHNGQGRPCGCARPGCHIPVEPPTSEEEPVVPEAPTQADVPQAPRSSGPTVSEPGVYQLTDAEYHADPVPEGSLSSSGAGLLLPPSCPALFHWYRSNPEKPKKAYDLGHAAHLMALGDGPKIHPVMADDWRTKAARDERDTAREKGKVPLLEKDVRRVVDMATALRAHPLAGALFDHTTGKPEQSLFWRDDETGIMRRARLDWLPDPRDTGRLILIDYKTAESADPGSFAKSAANYGYNRQHAWYIDAVVAVGLADSIHDVGFVFVVQEKDPPHLVNVIELDPVDVQIGRNLNRRAIATYVDCVRTDYWPGYTEGVELVSLPGWYRATHQEEASYT